MQNAYPTMLCDWFMKGDRAMPCSGFTLRIRNNQGMMDVK